MASGVGNHETICSPGFLKHCRFPGRHPGNCTPQSPGHWETPALPPDAEPPGQGEAQESAFKNPPGVSDAMASQSRVWKTPGVLTQLENLSVSILSLTGGPVKGTEPLNSHIKVELWQFLPGL